MARISHATRQQYLDKTNFCQVNINSSLKREAMLAVAFKKEDESTPLKRMALADEMLNLTSNYIILSEAMLSMLNMRNEDALHEARKSMHKALMYLEQVVTGYIDVPFSDYEDKVAAISPVDAMRRYNLVRKLGFAIDYLEHIHGANSKYKWSFVELEGRYAAITKNILELKTIASATEPDSPFYEPTVRHLELTKKLLTKAASRYRSKYELSTNHKDDFLMGIHFVGALRRLHIILGEPHEAAEIKKTYDAWTAKLDADVKRQEDAKKGH